MLSRKLSVLALTSAILLGTSSSRPRRTGCGRWSTTRMRARPFSPRPVAPHRRTSLTVRILTSRRRRAGGTIQFQIQGWYSNRTTQTIAASSGKWSSTNTSIAAVDANGFVTSAGPEGVTTVVVSAKGHTSTVIVGVCDPSVVVCPP